MVNISLLFTRNQCMLGGFSAGFLNHQQDPSRFLGPSESQVLNASQSGFPAASREAMASFSSALASGGMGGVLRLEALETTWFKWPIHETGIFTIQINQKCREIYQMSWILRVRFSNKNQIKLYSCNFLYYIILRLQVRWYHSIWMVK